MSFEAMATELAAGYVSVTVTEEQVRAIAKHISRAGSSRQVGMNGRHGMRFVGEFELP